MIERKFSSKNCPVGFYVYAYVRLADSANGVAGTPWYIGKGVANRAWKLHGSEGKRWAPNPEAVLIIQDGMTEQDALMLEIDLIAAWGNRNQPGGFLTGNFTEGGEGVKGLQWSDESKSNMSKIAKNRNASKAAIERQKERATKTALRHGIPVDVYLAMDHVEKHKAVRKAKRFGHWQAEGRNNAVRGREKLAAKALELAVPLSIYETLSAPSRMSLSVRNKRYGWTGYQLLTHKPKHGPTNLELAALADNLAKSDNWQAA